MRFPRTNSIFKPGSTEEDCSLPPITLSPSVLLPNLVEEGRRSPYSRTTSKSCRLKSNDSLLRRILTIGATFITQNISWCKQCSEKNVVLIMLESTINRVLTSWLYTGIGFKEKEKEKEREDKQGDWVEVPVELWEQIGKCLVESRLDILRFRSVCKAWRASLPAPTRFPLWVPRLPCDDELMSIFDGAPFFITEHAFYLVDVGSKERVLMEFELVDQGGKFCRYAFVPNGVKLNLPKESCMTPGLEHKLTFVGKAYLLRMALPMFDSWGERVAGKWGFRDTYLEVCKIVLISSNADHSVDESPASNLSVVALLAPSMKLALLRLGGSQYPDPHWGWDTSFCSDVFMDIATYKGQLCAVDSWGSTFVMDYDSLQMTQVAAPLLNYPQLTHVLSHLYPQLRGEWKQLIEARGDLYLVAKSHEVKVVKVYKLNWHLREWLEVDNIGNQVFFRESSCSISIPRDVLAGSYYERLMLKCNPSLLFAHKHDTYKVETYELEVPSLLFPHQHEDESDSFCLLGFTKRLCTPGLGLSASSILSLVTSTMNALTSVPVVTTTSSILSQYDRSIIGRTNYLALIRSLRRRGWRA